MAALLLAGLVPVLWPGDVPFINDEPQLIASAVASNSEGRLATLGLHGTYGFTYGPAPIWVYQALMTASRDLVGVAAMHILLMSAATAGAVWWLSQSLGLWVWFAPLPLLSPYYWFYARVLWDNPFLIPLGALALAGYAAHLASDSALGLRVSVAAMAAIPLVHLMGVSLLAPLAAHMLIVRWRSLWTHRVSLGAIVIAALALGWPYWTYLATPQSPSPGGGPALSGWLFPLFGGRLLGAGELSYFYGALPVGGRLFDVVAVVSSMTHALVWVGIIAALLTAVAAVRARRWTARAHVAVIAVAAILCQAVVDGTSVKFEHPHYQNGTWIAFVLLAWFTVDFVASRRGPWRWGAAAATSVLAVSLLVAVGALAVGLHRSGGTREIYGPTLANQQQVARALGSYSADSDVESRVSMWQRFPHALAILRQLNTRPGSDLPRRALTVRFASGDPASGRIEVVER